MGLPLPEAGALDPLSPEEDDGDEDDDDDDEEEEDDDEEELASVALPVLAGAVSDEGPPEVDEPEDELGRLSFL